MRHYADSSLDSTEDLLDSIDNNDPTYNTFTKFLGLRFNSIYKIYEVQCKWRGFANEEPTWEPFSTMREDITDMLERFLASHPSQDLVRAARSS